MVWFYGIQTTVGYLMPNPFICISTILFQTIQFSISKQFTSIRPIDKTLSGATTPGQSGSGSDGNEGVLHVSQSSSITRNLPSDRLVLYPGHSLVASLTPLKRSSRCILQPPPPPSRLGSRTDSITADSFDFLIMYLLNHSFTSRMWHRVIFMGVLREIKRKSARPEFEPCMSSPFPKWIAVTPHTLLSRDYRNGLICH